MHFIGEAFVAFLVSFTVGVMVFDLLGTVIRQARAASNHAFGAAGNGSSQVMSNGSSGSSSGIGSAGNPGGGGGAPSARISVIAANFFVQTVKGILQQQLGTVSYNRFGLFLVPVLVGALFLAFSIVRARADARARKLDDEQTTDDKNK
ncbi:hypothetical protein SPI_02382 [Niveomyces insectorum RCEF 264]|uniref:Uncharacterized protein n=1 Tax=Niveomyces insectorum RCEF 264 TaxID=1081102 RepID=A0A167XYV4_9HYPO|nr:hypothetical protein SPI_02382 [Niveomyces insectorum RCEF 264]